MTRREHSYHKRKRFDKSVKQLKECLYKERPTKVTARWQVIPVQIQEFEQLENELFTRSLCKIFNIPYELYEGTTIKAGTGNRTSNNMSEPTFGMKAVGLSFNPSGKSEVTHLKGVYAELIDILNEYREKATDPEVKRQISVAITEAQTSQMWAVKAVTWS